MDTNQQFEAVNQAFSKQSKIFDQIDSENVILQWMRKRVRSHVLSLIKPGSHILELNAGTGLDAIFFALGGNSVYATDIASGMVEVLKTKIDSFGLYGRVQADLLSFTDLGKLKDTQFDFIFSNFGGLNCVPDLKSVIDQFSTFLKPGGIVTLVIMPKICPWEIMALFKGNTALAFRRLKVNGAISNVEGTSFTTYYFNPAQVVRYFGNKYRVIKLQGLCSLVPPPSHQNFPSLYPRLWKTLIKIEEKIAYQPFFSSFADHFILSMQYKTE